jgi:hypothetical protein
MKRWSAIVLMALGVLVVFAVIPTSAQSSSSLKFIIPFDFIVQGETLPAGRYRVERFDKSRPDIMCIKSSDGKGRRIFFTHRAVANNEKSFSALVFKSYEGKYFLYEIWGAGEQNGRRLLPADPKSESRLTNAKSVSVPERGFKSKVE